jgi:hypothetical protein
MPKNCQFSPSYHGYGFQNFLVIERPAGSVEVAEIDGGVSHGPLHTISVNLRPMEIQILGK